MSPSSPALPDPSGFSIDWLRRREPFDRVARSRSLGSQFAEALRTAVPNRPIRIVDLAAGLGSNFRFLAPLVAADQEWLLTDRDSHLLALQGPEIARWAETQGWTTQTDDRGIEVRTGQAIWRATPTSLDLIADLDRLADLACDGFTTAAFLDLVSERWLQAFSAIVAAQRKPLLAVMNVDGGRNWYPAAREDSLILDAFVRHQKMDKGFGPGLGGMAPDVLASLFESQGYLVASEPADWRIARTQTGMLRDLLAGEVVADEQLNDRVTQAWLDRRYLEAENGNLSATIGHRDVLVLPRD